MMMEQKEKTFKSERNLMNILDRFEKEVSYLSEQAGKSTQIISKIVFPFVDDIEMEKCDNDVMDDPIKNNDLISYFERTLLKVNELTNTIDTNLEQIKNFIQ